MAHVDRGHLRPRRRAGDYSTFTVPDTGTTDPGPTTDTTGGGGDDTGTETGTIPADYDVYYVDIATWTVQR